MTPTYGIATRERVTVSLLGRNLEMLRQGDTQWIARNDPTVTMTAVDGKWQVVDANGVSYSFKMDPSLNGTGGPGLGDSGGLWLLDTISGRGGAKVQLDYKIVTPDGPTGPRISIDLQDIKYNPDATGCFKHEIDLSYEQVDAGVAPQAISILGERVLVRYHKLDAVVVGSRSSCAGPPNQLRSYELTYATDQDTQQRQLSTVVEHGRPDITSGTQTLPVATYHYGTASTLHADGHVSLDYGASTTSTPPSGSSANDATTVKTSLFQPPVSGSAYAAWQTLQDFNGDGRADLVFTDFTTGQLEIAAGQPGGGFGSPVALADGTLTRNVVDARSSSVDRFASETTTDDQMQDFVWTQSIDVNGDGRIDILDAAEKPHTWVAYLNMPDSGPSGVKWVRRELDVSRLQTQLLQHRLNVPTDYLPLSGRKTGRDLGYHFHWVWNDADQKYEISAALGDPPLLNWSGDEQTYTEFKVIDINGDGYPDVVFNTSPVGYPVPDPPITQNGVNHDPYYADSHLHFGVIGPSTIGVAYNTGGVFLDDTATNPFSDEVSLSASSDGGVEWWSGDDTLHDRRQVLHSSFADVNGDGLIDRVEGNTVSLGTGFDFRTVQLTLPAGFLAAQDSQYLDKCNNGSDTFHSAETVELRDLTGDGIPDLEIWSVNDNRFEVFVGTGAGFSTVAMPTNAPLTQVDERCNGGGSWTTAGLYDVNGDGRPDIVSIASSISVSQLSGGSQPGVPEAGRITSIDNGYGATISVSYTSAKGDTQTAHNVPFPEIVVSSIKTDGTFGLGGTLAETAYAYGTISMFYDSVLDAFRTLGYQRRVAVTTTGIAKGGGPSSTAIVTDAYPLEAVNPATFQFLSENQRIGRYLQAGRVSDTTTLVGVAHDAWALLSVDVTSDLHRVAGTHYSIDTMDTHLYTDATSPSNEACVDVVFPFDYHASNLQSSYDPCSVRSFLYTRSTQSWRGSEAPPSQQNVQVYTSVRSVDDFGRITSIIYQNDASQEDDDVCVDTTYASPTNSTLHVLTAPAARKVWACGIKEDGHTVAEESWEYDKQLPNFVFEGKPTAHTIYRHATDTGAFLGMSREYDADYDGMANPVKVTSTRDLNTWRTTTIAYDAFGLSATEADVVGSDATMRSVKQVTDPTSGALLSSTDENGTTYGYTWDAFGRPSTTTVQRHDDAQPGTLSVRTYDEDSCTPHGRRISLQTFADPVVSGGSSAVAHLASTCLDELGRERYSEVQLGGDYNDTMIVGKRTYDPQGRIVFEADAYPKSQDEATAYGTSRFFDEDGSLHAEVRGPGAQPYPYIFTPDPANEIFATLYWHIFDNHVETTGVRTPDSFVTGSPQESVYREAVSTGIGRVLSRSTYQNGPIERADFAYDILGNQVTIDRYGGPADGTSRVTWSWQFDSLGHVTSLSEPANAPQTRTYDSWGELTKIEWQPTSPEPVHGIEMSYDSLGRTLSSYEENNHVLDPLTVNTYSYDVAGSSSRFTPQYVMGRLAKASSPTEDIVLGYDGLGNVNARSFTDLNNVEYVEQQGVHADGSQAWIQLQLPDNGYATERVDYDYDSASRLRWMWFSNGQTTQELYNADQLDPFGRVRHAMFGATTYAANYFDVGRRLPKSVNVASTLGTRTIEFDGFDAVGRELSRAETVPNAGGTTTSTYDALGRLVKSVRVLGTSTKHNWSFNYDPLGNMTSLANTVAHTSVTVSYQSSGQTDFDQLCNITFFGPLRPQCNVVHDSFGNVVSEPSPGGANSFSYFNSGDVKNISNTAGMTATFAYDPFGDVQDLNIASASGQVRHDQHFGGLITLRSQNAHTPSTSFISRQFPGPGLTISRRGSQGSWVFQFSEPRGTRFTVDANGNFLQDLSYTPYGAATSTGAAAGTSTFTTDQWNDGDALDGFGLTKVGKRIYDPAIGRFLSRDPLAIPRTASTTNPYAFAMNDPLNLSDPSGMDVCSLSTTCSITSTYGDGGPIGIAASAGALAAEIYFSFGVNPNFSTASLTTPQRAAYSAAFDHTMSVAADWRKSEADFQEMLSEDDDGLPSAWPIHPIAYRLQTVAIDVAWVPTKIWEQWTKTVEAIGDDVPRINQHGDLVHESPTAAGQRASFDMVFVATGLSAASAALEGVDFMAGEVDAANPVAGSVRYVNPTRGGANCVGCAIATDATLAGRPASAMPGGPWNVVESMEAYRSGAVGLPANGPSGIRTILRNWGPGSRAIVWGTRAGEEGHAFNVVNQGGIIRFLDGQTGGVAVETGYDGYYVFRTK